MTYSKLIVPQAMLYGKDARLAVEKGMALPIAHGFTAFSLAKVINRNSQKISFMSVDDLQGTDDAELKQQLHNIMQERPNICGLNMTKPHVMGILNLTPDSFSDGGQRADLEKLERQVDQYIQCGLSILDVGGESTRPNADYVNCAQEIDRIAPVLEMLKGKDVCVSVDTRKAKVMQFALDAGADIVNDVSALEFRAEVKINGEDSGDSEQVVIDRQCPTILMHSQGTPEMMQNNPQYDDILFEIYDYLSNRIKHLGNAGLEKNKLIADPGIGFGKTAEHCLTILNGLSVFHSLGVPVLLGASRKSFFGFIDKQADASQRLGGSLAATQVGLNAGIQLHRVHDVEEAVQQNQTMSAIYN